jgi:hypothetical protein
MWEQTSYIDAYVGGDMKAMKLDRVEVEIEPTWEAVGEFFGVDPRDLQIEKTTKGYTVTVDGKLVGKIDGAPR